MIPVKQTKLSSGDGKVYGNCLRACLASLLEVDIDSIPAFEDKFGLKSNEWYTDFTNYLSSCGLKDYGYIGVKTEPPTQEELNNYIGLDGYYIVCGKSPREHVKNGHAVIYYKGQPIHDPHPDNTFLTELWFIWRIEPERSSDES